MPTKVFITAIAAATAVTVIGCASTDEVRPAQGPKGEAAERVAVDSQTFRPQQLEFDETLLEQIKVPAGFRIDVFAKNLKDARMMAVGPDGTVYLSRRDPGEVVALKDTDNDGTADAGEPVAKIKDAHGLAIHDNKLYIAAVNEVYVADIHADGKLSEPRKIISDLPDGGQHPNRTLAVGPDNQLYISIGSTCNACDETNAEHATIVRASLDGKQRKLFAGGLRNTIGFGWHPVTKQMWGMDHGSDDRGNDIPPEELNVLQANKDYGWPFAYGNREVDPVMKEPQDKRRGPDKATIARNSEPMTLGYTAHAAPIGMAFYTADQFPDEYRNDAFIAMHGSWNAYPAVGYSVVRLRFDKDGKPQKFEEFATGWLTNNGKSHFGRPAGIAVAKDGALLVSDDANGVVYRISYKRDVASAR